MAGENSGQYAAHLKSHANDAQKQYFVYDANDRMTHAYTAYTEASNGAPCLVTEYSYVSPTSTLVQKMKEYMGTWSSAYDI